MTVIASDSFAAVGRLESPPGPEVVIDGRPYLYFAGTGYLGLQAEPAVIDAAAAAVSQYGLHTATTRAGFLVCPLIEQVEAAVADWFGCESSFYFASGYLGAAAVARQMAARFDHVLIDSAAHYCLFDAARATELPVESFAHLDVDHFASRLAAAGERALVLTDGLFAATGELAPLAAYWDLLQAYEHAAMLVDDAHGVGVLGAQGRGSWEYHRLSADNERRFACATLSKALGGYGGIVTGTRNYIDDLKSQASIYGGATPPPPAVAAGSLAALQMLTEGAERRQQLADNVDYLRQRLAALGLSIVQSPSPVISWSMDNAERMRTLQAALQAAGIMIAYLPNYAGVGGEGILRLAVFATHTTEMLDRLLDQLRPLL